MRNVLPLFCLLNLCCALPQASAHYLWVTVDTQTGKHGTANIYFEGGPAPGDGHYLDHYTGTGKTWIRTVDDLEPQLLTTTDISKNKKRWLQTALPAGQPRSVDSYFKFGVYAYGKTNVLLHYYARNLDVRTHEDLHELGRAEQMHLELVPHDHEDELELTVRWKGKATPDRTVHIRGPKNFKQNIKTNKQGRISFKPEHSGRYTFRASVEEPTPGKDGDDAYDLIRHNGTLLMTLPLEK